MKNASTFSFLLSKFYYILLFSIFYFLLSTPTHAAAPRMYLQASNEEAGINSEFTVKVLVDSDIPLNAYAAEINYPPQFLEPVQFDNSHSIINVWHDEPIVFSNGWITFNGGRLTPFAGEGGELLTIRFKAMHSGSAELTLANMTVYAADGKGTVIVPETRPLNLAILSGVISPKEIVAQDVSPPEIKFFSIVPDPFNPSHKFLGITAVDPDSGVKEIVVRWRAWFLWDEWQLAKNPLVIPTNAWSVQAKVFNNQGNITIKTIYDWRAFRSQLTIFLAAILAIAVIFAVIVAVINRRRKAKGSYNK